MNRIFRRRGGNVVPDGTLVFPFLNPADSTNDLPVELFDGASLALGEIRPKQASKIQMHPVVTLMLWVISGRLALKLKDSESEAPYVLELGAEDGAVARPGTFLQLINNASEPCRVLYIVSPAYVFLQTNGKMVYDDAIVFDSDWDALARQSWRPAPVRDLDCVRAEREKALQELKARKGTARFAIDFGQSRSRLSTAQGEFAAMDDKDQRLDHLMTYTVFHIGVYLSLVTALISVGLLKDFDHGLLRFSIGCFLIAGICGAVVASNIPDHPDFKSYSKDPIGPWGLQLLRYSTWATIEHLAFWIGLLPIVVGFLIWGPQLFK